jgi:hypothetical protein
MRATAIFNEIHKDFNNNPNTVFNVRIGGKIELMTIEFVRYENNDQGKQIPYAYGYVVGINERNDYTVERVRAVKVTMPYVRGVEFSSTIEMRKHFMAIDAKANYSKYNY